MQVKVTNVIRMPREITNGKYSSIYDIEDVIIDDILSKICSM